MATVGNVGLTFTVSGGPSGQRTYNQAFTIAAGVDATTVVSCTTGDNTITVPSGATWCFIIPPNATSPVPNPPVSSTLKTKNTGADAGEPISNTRPSVKAWDTATAPASFIINASSSCTVEVVFV